MRHVRRPKSCWVLPYHFIPFFWNSTLNAFKYKRKCTIWAIEKVYKLIWIVPHHITSATIITRITNSNSTVCGLVLLSKRMRTEFFTLRYLSESGGMWMQYASCHLRQFLMGITRSLKLNWLHNKEFQNVNNNSMENKIFCVCSGVNYQPFWRKIVRNSKTQGQYRITWRMCL